MKTARPAQKWSRRPVVGAPWWSGARQVPGWQSSKPRPMEAVKWKFAMRRGESFNGCHDPCERLLIPMDRDEQAIRSLISTWMEASAARALPRVLELMADDVLFVGP